MSKGPETTLTWFEMPAMLLLCVSLFSAACWKVDPTLWRVATLIPFTAAGTAFFFALYAAAKSNDDQWR